MSRFNINLATSVEAGYICEQRKVLNTAFSDNAHDQVAVDFVVRTLQNLPAGVFITGAEGIHAPWMFMIISHKIQALFLELPKFFVQDLHVSGGLEISNRACLRERGGWDNISNQTFVIFGADQNTAGFIMAFISVTHFKHRSYCRHTEPYFNHNFSPFGLGETAPPPVSAYLKKRLGSNVVLPDGCSCVPSL